MGSEFDERVNYQRALEGELEHTISSPGRGAQCAGAPGAAAGEHVRERGEDGQGFGVVEAEEISRLGQEQIDSMRNLVAGAVENLTPEQVTLVDAGWAGESAGKAWRDERGG